MHVFRLSDDAGNHIENMFENDFVLLMNGTFHQHAAETVFSSLSFHRGAKMFAARPKRSYCNLVRCRHGEKRGEQWTLFCFVFVFLKKDKKMTLDVVWKLLDTGISWHMYSRTSFMMLIIFQAKLEELQSEKQNFVSQKEAADDGNRKLVSAECVFFCLILNT